MFLRLTAAPKQGAGVRLIQTFVEMPTQNSSRAAQLFSELKKHLKLSEGRPKSYNTVNLY